jgi:MoxR-like ATPase
MTGTNYWFLNKPSSVDQGELADYLRPGIWKCPDSAIMTSKLSSMKVGDQVALKAVVNRRSGLPYFNGDNLGADMSIFATGVIQAVDVESGKVSIGWVLLPEVKHWYFWTHTWSIWRVDPQEGHRAHSLIDFTFHDMPQNLASFLNERYWSGRFGPWPGLSWIPFYEEFATKLLAYKDDRAKLVQIILRAGEQERLLDYLVHERDEDGNSILLTDVDPFTVMGTFNRGVRIDNRKSIAALLGRVIGVSAPIPNDFAAIPILNALNAKFVSNPANRDPEDIDLLWCVLESGVALAAENSTRTSAAFEQAYENARRVHGVKWNLSMGLFWARPMAFATLDSLSRDYIAQRYEFPEDLTGGAYLKLRNDLLAQFADGASSITSFPLLSYAAWTTAESAIGTHDMPGMAAWACRMAESEDLEALEHDFKRGLAKEMAAALDLADRDMEACVDALQRTLVAANFLDFRFVSALKTALADAPEEVLSAILAVRDNPQPSSLDDFHAALRVALGSVTPGNSTALGALILMSVDADEFAPYSPTRTKKWYELTQFFDKAPPRSPSVRYVAMLEFLDELREELAHRPIGSGVSRLEAQGLAWAATEYEIPRSWEPQERRSLMEWRGDTDLPSESNRAWIVRGPAADWVPTGFVSLGATYLGTMSDGATRGQIKQAVEAGYQHQDYAQRQQLLTDYSAFLNVMDVGDLVVTQADSYLHIGFVSGPSYFVEIADSRLRRDVEWRASIASGAIPDVIAGLLKQQGALVDVTDSFASLRALAEGGSVVTPEEPVMPKSTFEGIPSLPDADDALVKKLSMGVDHLQEIIDLLGSRQQIVLYGPPGTGKTYVAKKIAEHIIGSGDPSSSQLVQFHPSYAYEDFFEGFRPFQTDAGQAGFLLQAGPLKRMAEAARRNPRQPYVLVIDEMNRANLAKVFGELYFLLEYRDDAMALQYSPGEAFQLPRNLFFIGTMNTADRSIALLDAAMRRRFSFIELHPDEEPVKSMLPKWLAVNEFSGDRASLLEALNSRMSMIDRDFKIGPSYLMRPEAATEQGLERIWKHDILPLLEEHYYGQMEREAVQKRFGLTAIRKAAGKDGAGISGELDAEAADSTDQVDDEDE